MFLYTKLFELLHNLYQKQNNRILNQLLITDVQDIILNLNLNIFFIHL